MRDVSGLDFSAFRTTHYVDSMFVVRLGASFFSILSFFDDPSGSTSRTILPNSVSGVRTIDVRLDQTWIVTLMLSKHASCTARFFLRTRYRRMSDPTHHGTPFHMHVQHKPRVANHNISSAASDCYEVSQLSQARRSSPNNARRIPLSEQPIHSCSGTLRKCRQPWEFSGTYLMLCSTGYRVGHRYPYIARYRAVHGI